MHLWSRSGRDWSVEFSGITAALKAWKLSSSTVRPWRIVGGPALLGQYGASKAHLYVDLAITFSTNPRCHRAALSDLTAMVQIRAWAGRGSIS